MRYKESFKFILLIFSVMAFAVVSAMFFAPVIRAF